MSVVELYQLIRDFCRDHWELITFIVWLIALIILLCKKKITIKDAIFTMALKVLPNFIQVAEDKYPVGNGDLKKELVVDSMIQFIMSVSDLSRKEVITRYGLLIEQSIEDILSCPKKKGD